MTLPKPSTRLAIASDGADGDTPSVIGLRWSFVFQTFQTGSNVFVETARREHNQLKFKLPQFERPSSQICPIKELRRLLHTGHMAAVNAVSYSVLAQSEPMYAVVPEGFKDENILGIIYVHVSLNTTNTFQGNDFLKPMAPQDLLEACQSYRHTHYKRVLKQFRLI